MLERKRRARINRCLDELKELLVGALQAEGESVSRLEKADVLELTVRHLHKLRRSQQLSESSAGERFRQGFVHCANEVSKYISSAMSASGANGFSLDLAVSTRLVSHLDQCIRSIESSQIHQQFLHPPSVPPTLPQGSPRAPQLSSVYPVPASAAMISPGGPSQIRESGGLNILTSYTPPSSPISPSSSSSSGSVSHHQKIYYIPSSSMGGSPTSSSTGSLSPIPPAHYNSNAFGNHGVATPQPLSLSMRSVSEEPFDLSNNLARPWRPW